MSRLTKRINEHVYYTLGKYPETIPAECESSDVRTILRALAVYEDTGLTPEEVAALRAQPEPDGWIEVEETPPGDIGLWVWLFPHEDGVVLAQYIGEGFYRVDRRSIYGTYFTHWMPAHLPEPPREG